MPTTYDWNDIVELSIDDCKQSTLLDLQSLGFATTAWQQFATPALYTEINARFRNTTSKYAVYFKNAFMAESSRGDTLTRVLRSFFKLVRNDAVEARHEVEIACDATHGPHSIAVGTLVFQHANGSVFRNVEDGVTVYPVNLATGGSLTLLVEAQTAGTLANVASAATPADVTIKLQTTLAGVLVQSHEIERSGLEEEDDGRATERAQLKWARNLPKLGLIDEGVKASALEAAPAVVSVDVDATNPRGIGTFDVYVAGLDASASVDDVSLVQVALDAQTFGRFNVPKTCIVYKSPLVTIFVTGVVYFTNTTAELAKAAGDAAILAYARSVPLGGFNYNPGPQHVVPKNDLESAIREAVKALTSSKVTVVLDGPVGDTAVLAHGKVLIDATGVSYQLSSS